MALGNGHILTEDILGRLERTEERANKATADIAAMQPTLTTVAADVLEVKTLLRKIGWVLVLAAIAAILGPNAHAVLSFLGW